MAQDRSKFAKIEKPSLEGFAQWILSEEFKSRKRMPSNLEDAWMFYHFHHEKKTVNRMNYRYWVAWMKKNRLKAIDLYPFHTYLFIQRHRNKKNLKNGH